MEDAWGIHAGKNRGFSIPAKWLQGSETSSMSPANPSHAITGFCSGCLICTTLTLTSKPWVLNLDFILINVSQSGFVVSLREESPCPGMALRCKHSFSVPHWDGWWLLLEFTFPAPFLQHIHGLSLPCSSLHFLVSSLQQHLAGWIFPALWRSFFFQLFLRALLYFLTVSQVSTFMSPLLIPPQDP